jgi:nitrogen regulatory protein PII
MKRIELVIEPSALECFMEAAKGLDLPDFDITEVRRTTGSIRNQSQRLYRGREFVPDLVERVKIDLNVADDAAMRIAHEFIENVRPESIAILRLDPTAAVRDDAVARPTHIASVPNVLALVAAH